MRAGEDVSYICIDGGSKEKRRYIFPHEQRMCIFPDRAKKMRFSSYSEDVFFLTEQTRLYFSSQYKEGEFFLTEQKRCNFSYGANKMYFSLRSKEGVFSSQSKGDVVFATQRKSYLPPPPTGRRSCFFLAEQRRLILLTEQKNVFFLTEQNYVFLLTKQNDIFFLTKWINCNFQ